MIARTPITGDSCSAAVNIPAKRAPSASPALVAFRTRDKWHWGGIFKTASLFTTTEDRPIPYDPMMLVPPTTEPAKPKAVAAETKKPAKRKKPGKPACL